jgi:CheY-like chemotaxis protein
MTAPLGLVVDDDRHIRSFFAKVIRGGGMDILEASSGRQALALVTIMQRLLVTRSRSSRSHIQ